MTLPRIDNNEHHVTPTKKIKIKNTTVERYFTRAPWVKVIPTIDYKSGHKIISPWFRVPLEEIWIIPDKVIFNWHKGKNHASD